jgi:hypothetical protein
MTRIYSLCDDEYDRVTALIDDDRVTAVNNRSPSLTGGKSMLQNESVTKKLDHASVQPCPHYQCIPLNYWCMQNLPNFELKNWRSVLVKFCVIECMVIIGEITECAKND